jgi:hypothetical protein
MTNIILPLSRSRSADFWLLSLVLFPLHKVVARSMAFMVQDSSEEKKAVDAVSMHKESCFSLSIFDGTIGGGVLNVLPDRLLYQVM